MLIEDLILGNIFTTKTRSSIISLKSENKTKRIYTDPILIALPTPDFSMPYNVITLTCTILSMFFVSMFGLLIKRLQPIPLINKIIS